MIQRSKQLFLPFFAALAVALFFGALAALPASAQDPQPTPSDNDVNRVAKQMFCPVCENIPLDVCPTQACSDWRELIRLKLSQGWTDEQIKAYFAEQYGDRVLAEPPRRGLNWLVYVLPLVAVVVGVAIVTQVLRSMRARGGASAGSAAASGTPVPPGSPVPSDPKSSDPYIARLEEELRKKK